MKCPYCGSPLGLEDEFCSFCGQPNTLAQKHQKDMQHYRTEYDQTKQDVYTKTRRFTSLTVPIIILFVLFILNIAAIIFKASAWEIGENIEVSKIMEHEDEHRKNLEQFINASDYYGFSNYFSNNSLYLADSFDEYQAIDAASDYCSSIYQNLMSNIYVQDENVDKEYLESNIRSLTLSLQGLFSIESDYSYAEDTALTKEKLAVIHDIQAQGLALLVTYAGLTPEEAAQLPDMSITKQKETLEGRLMAS
ncbi:MAG: zinc ribbon domain-containing protein [Clostridia bacterium]|nr:zinc ribbon domain-containing protein [Clostridia bacterium]